MRQVRDWKRLTTIVKFKNMSAFKTVRVRYACWLDRIVGKYYVSLRSPPKTFDIPYVYTAKVFITYHYEQRGPFYALVGITTTQRTPPSVFAWYGHPLGYYDCCCKESRIISFSPMSSLLQDQTNTFQQLINTSHITNKNIDGQRNYQRVGTCVFIDNRSTWIIELVAFSSFWNRNRFPSTVVAFKTRWWFHMVLVMYCRADGAEWDLSFNSFPQVNKHKQPLCISGTVCVPCLCRLSHRPVRTDMILFLCQSARVAALSILLPFFLPGVGFPFSSIPSPIRFIRTHPTSSYIVNLHWTPGAYIHTHAFSRTLSVIIIWLIRRMCFPTPLRHFDFDKPKVPFSPGVPWCSKSLQISRAARPIHFGPNLKDDFSRPTPAQSSSWSWQPLKTSVRINSQSLATHSPPIPADHQF